ncbi:Rha family transcriptional regulator [Ligilactobacillus animalis]|uniref:Rha family transcriptional regulator n=1 Tax=Ligilactobacillus animalis TaxID=1605 RepID=UPI0026480FB6|nr:Rha family transcriptional regulator [Ligilactobacillus animalis]WKB73113.1 Rha family transcriptional regulator [Ligilactobacillus animalis]
MQELVFLQSLQDDPYTTPEVIAEHTGIEYRSISDLIRRNKSELEFFGVLRFEIVKPTNEKGGRPKKIYHLNEQQATTLITFLDNTPQVKTFKVALVAEFFKLRDEKAKWQLQRLSEKPIKRELQDAIKNWKYYAPHMYSNINALLVKSVTGLDVKKLKNKRGNAKTALDLLTVEEQERYEQNERKTIAYIEAGFTYKQIKALLNGAKMFVAIDEK